MAGEEYINVDPLCVQGHRGDGQQVGTRTSEIQQDIQSRRLNAGGRGTWIYPLVAVGFTVTCILQLSLSIFLRWHYMNSTAEDNLKAVISNLTNTTSAQIDQLKAELNDLASMKAAEIEQLKAELNNLASMKAAEIEQLLKDKREIETKLCRMEGSCEGWVGFKTSTYYVSTEKKSWTESRQDCKDRGADLVVINSEEEQRFLHSLHEVTWIGLSDQEADRVFHWVDGGRITFNVVYWGTDQPTYEDELCVTIFRYFAFMVSWFDRPCEESNHWICEKHRFLL
ncbi:CD209 antigen-like protein C [Sardina pilchardus]|uniref:CD209 antigen-like protein C n=1 Tax=Sardina pilchardus TaxID=27697 RepID=UPI002E11F30B